MDKSPCRLFVISARDAPLAVILRRGPSKWYHLIRWHTEQDTFEQGAWFRGRIYEERCDLSPDGTLFVAMCHGGSCRPGYTYAWTAVSRAPWMYALALWPWSGTYGGGGRFLHDRCLALHVNMPMATHPDHPSSGLEVIIGNSPAYHRSSGELEGTDWSGRDHRGRLVYCQGGRLFRRENDPTGPDQQIADFSNLRPSPQPAPDWARRPLERGP